MRNFFSFFGRLPGIASFLLALPAGAFAQSSTIVGSFGTAGAGNGQFNGPTGVAFSPAQNCVYVVENFGRRLQRFSTNGIYQSQTGSSGAGSGQFFGPFGVGTGNGMVYVADSGNNRIQQFMDTTAIAFQSAWGGVAASSAAGFFASPEGVAANATSGQIYVADANNSRIQRFSSTGAFLSTWGTAGIGPAEFGKPSGVAVDAATGQVYVADSIQHRIKRFDASGNFLSQWGGEGAATGQFQNPAGLAIGPEGIVVVADTGNHRIQIFNRDGVFLIALGTVGPGPEQYNTPTGVSVTPAGLAYVADSGNHRISTFQYTNAAPTVAIKDAPRGAVDKARLSLKGSATDDGTVVRVEVKVGKGAFQTAVGRNAWRFVAKLKKGRNPIEIRSIDLGGKVSAVRRLSVIRS